MTIRIGVASWKCLNCVSSRSKSPHDIRSKGRAELFHSPMDWAWTAGNARMLGDLRWRVDLQDRPQGALDNESEGEGVVKTEDEGNVDRPNLRREKTARGSCSRGRPIRVQEKSSRKSPEINNRGQKGRSRRFSGQYR